jgi:hypothetical protein
LSSSQGASGVWSKQDPGEVNPKKIGNSDSMMTDATEGNERHYPEATEKRSVRALGGRVALIGLFLAQSGGVAAPAGLKTLHGHVPEITRRLSPKAPLAADKQLNLAIGLPLGNEDGLSNFLEQVYDTASPSFHRYLTPQQFADQFGPSQAQYDGVVAFAKKNHLTVTAQHGNRLVLDVRGAAADVQKAFHINLQTYQHPTEPRDFYAPDSEPSVDPELPVLDVSGLSNYNLPKPRSIEMPRESSSAASALTGSGPSGTYQGNDFRAAYAPGVALTGAGQTLGLVQFDGFYASDISSYETAAGLPQVALQTVLLDGYNGVPTTGTQSGNPEVSLDIETAVSMAPGLSKIIVFEAGPNGLQNDILSAMTAHSEAKQLSCSWGWGGGPSATTDNLFKQMAAQGQSFFSASGDSDAFPTGAVDDPNQQNAPSSCPNITVVGGTTLTTAGPGGAWVSESVWNRGGGVGSSGGISSSYALPSWQTGISMSSSGGSTTHRNTPDVACAAENIYVKYGNGTNGAFGGTSCAAPLWAGFTALMNQQAALTGRSPVGFINPGIYQIGKGSAYSSMFHDIVAGNNTWSGSSSAFYAVSGYDLCTGWGSPGGASLITALAGVADSLVVYPTSGLTASGPVGGPFSSLAETLFVTNSGSTAVTWSLVNNSSWVQMDSAGGTIAAGLGGTVHAQLTASANQLPEGVYVDNLLFSNTVSHSTQSVPFTLNIGQSLVANGGFESGDFSGWTLSGRTVINSSSGSPTVYNAVESNTSGYQVAHSGTYGAFLGDTQLATLSQTIPTIPGNSYLLSFWLNNPTTGTGQTFVVNWGANNPGLTTVYNLSVPPVLAWTNLQFVLTASGTNTTIEFGAENDPAGFGLDDVSLKPLPAIGFHSIGRSNGGIELSWAGANGVSYQLQYSTNLLQGPWIDVGGSVAGKGTTITVTDSTLLTNATQRFYRLAVAR